MLTQCRTIGFRLGLIVLVVLILVLAGCGGEEPTPTTTPEAGAIAATPVVTILKNPNISKVPTGGQVALAAETTRVDLKITWRPKRGKVSNTEGPSTIYTAPATPGIDTVDVMVTSDSGSTNKTVTFTVVEAATERPAPSNTPAVTPALIKTPTSTPATPTVMARVTATSTPPRGALTPSPTPTAGTATVQIDGEYSVIQLTTGLGKTVTLNYRNVDTGNDVLNHIVSNHRQKLGTEQFVVRIADDVYMIMPLMKFRQAREITKTTQLITLADGEEIEGQLAFTLSDPDDVEYDLRTAKAAVLISLSDNDHNVEQREKEQAELWQLEILDPVNVTYPVSNPRFAFQWSRMSIVGSYYDYETTSQSFYLRENDIEHLANLPDLDEIKFGAASRVTVRIGDVETAGTVVLKAPDGHRGCCWFFVVDLADDNTVIALRNPKAILHKVVQ